MLNHSSLVNLLWRSALILTTSGLAVVFGNSASAQIQPDNTLGTQNSIVNDIDALNKRIDGGIKLDANLFHSFREFNVSEGGSVYFANPQGITDIFSRVTGNNPSNIFGKLGVLGDANLFLINPNGIVFGENASLDLQGSFVATTANGIEFGEQGVFSASNPEVPRLLDVNPSALFFNAVNNQAGIQNNSVAPAGTNPAGGNALGLRVADGKSLLLVGGDVSMDGGQLNAYGGRVELGGLAAPGNVNLLFEGDNLKLGFPENVTRADVSLTNKANVGVISKGGSVAVNARNLNILGSSIVSGVSSGGVNTQAGNIEINTTNTTTIDGTSSTTSFSGIASGLVGGSGSAGDITINTGSLDVINAVIGSLTNGEGNAGNVTITAKDKVSLTNGGITSIVASSDGGNGANVSIEAQEISFANSAIITNSIGKGSSGNIQIKAYDSVFVTGSSTISSDTFGQGNAGSIDIEAGNLISFDGVGSNDRTRQVSSRVNPLIVSTPEFTGKRIGGDINIKTGSLLMKDAKLETSTYGKGNAGNVKVTTLDTVSLADAEIISTVEAGGDGQGGNIDINTTTLLLNNGAELETSTYGKGNAGNVKVTATDGVSLAGAYIFSTVEAGGVGQGGNIDINAATLSLTDGAQLQTSTDEASNTQSAGQGDAGNVNVKVTGSVDIAGEKNGIPSAVFSSVETGTKGDGGNITIDSGSFSLTDGALLRASTFGIGDAGNVKVTATDTVSLTDAKIFSTVEAGGEGHGGNIDINAATLSLTDGAQLLTLTRGASDTQPPGKGNAGNVQVKVSGSVDIAGEKNGFYSGIYSVADTGTVGNAGNITIDSGSFSLRDGALINARTKTDDQGGNVTVNTDIFEALNGGQMVAITSGNGSAGKIIVNASEKTTISGSDPNYDNRLVQFPDYVPIIGTNSGLFVNSSSLGNTGDIEVNSPQIILDNQGKLDANSTSGNGGNINLTSDLLLMRHGAEISTNAGTAQQGGDGGNININSKFIVAPSQENSDITANAFSGTGGNVEILSQGIFGIEPRDRQTDKSDITASSELGVPGNLNLTDPDDSSIRNNLSDLPDNQIDTNTIIANSCIVRSNEQNGTFLITGSGGLPQNPSDAPLSNYSTGSIRPIPSNSEKAPASNRQSWKIGDPVVEPQGVYKLPNGQLVLSREC
jgi:filamentous hemagglutinin family protein